LLITGPIFSRKYSKSAFTKSASKGRAAQVISSARQPLRSLDSSTSKPLPAPTLARNHTFHRGSNAPTFPMRGVLRHEACTGDPRLQDRLILRRIDRPEQAVSIATPAMLFPIRQQLIREFSSKAFDTLRWDATLVHCRSHFFKKELEMFVRHFRNQQAKAASSLPMGRAVRGTPNAQPLCPS
jgi:hypothetical protein